MSRPTKLLVIGASAGGALILMGVLVAGPALLGQPSAPAPAEAALERLDIYGEVPDFTLVERSGRPVGRADLVGKVWLMNFIYTECTETCPTQSLQVARLQAEFADAPDLRLVSITVDPRHDTREVLTEYASSERRDNRPRAWQMNCSREGETRWRRHA